MSDFSLDWPYGWKTWKGDLVKEIVMKDGKIYARYFAMDIAEKTTIRIDAQGYWIEEHTGAPCGVDNECRVVNCIQPISRTGWMVVWTCPDDKRTQICQTFFDNREAAERAVAKQPNYRVVPVRIEEIEEAT